MSWMVRGLNPNGKKISCTDTVQPQGPPSPPHNGLPGLFLRGIRQLGYGFDLPPPPSTEANIRVELYFYPHPSMPLWHVTE